MKKTVTAFIESKVPAGGGVLVFGLSANDWGDCPAAGESVTVSWIVPDEHKCERAVGTDVYRTTAGSWKAFDTRNGTLDCITHCPWCGEKLPGELLLRTRQFRTVPSAERNYHEEDGCNVFGF